MKCTHGGIHVQALVLALAFTALASPAVVSIWRRGGHRWYQNVSPNPLPTTISPPLSHHQPVFESQFGLSIGDKSQWFREADDFVSKIKPETLFGSEPLRGIILEWPTRWEEHTEAITPAAYMGRRDLCDR